MLEVATGKSSLGEESTYMIGTEKRAVVVRFGRIGSGFDVFFSSWWQCSSANQEFCISAHPYQINEDIPKLARNVMTRRNDLIAHHT